MVMMHNPISVGIFTDKKQFFERYSNDLLTAGFNLSFQESGHAICIVDQKELEKEQDFWFNKATPFIISGIINSDQCTSFLGSYPSTVGFLNDVPTISEITFNLIMGLHIFNERLIYSRRVEGIDEKISNNRTIGIAVGALHATFGGEVEDIVDRVKVLSRNKQKRLVDVAMEITSLLEPSSVLLGQPMDEWLDARISIRA